MRLRKDRERWSVGWEKEMDVEGYKGEVRDTEEERSPAIATYIS